MGGLPVWLVSVSYRPFGIIKGTEQWSEGDFKKAEALAHRVLEGIGDSEKERAFRMNITFCIHRAVSREEIDNLPGSYCDLPGGLAGGPVEVLWSRGIKHTVSAMPCVNPHRKIINWSRLDLWVPEDCQMCEPCLARLAIEGSMR